MGSSAGLMDIALSSDNYCRGTRQAGKAKSRDKKHTVASFLVL